MRRPSRARRQSQVVLTILALLMLANAAAGFAMLPTASIAGAVLLVCSVVLAVVGAMVARAGLALIRRGTVVAMPSAGCARQKRP